MKTQNDSAQLEGHLIIESRPADSDSESDWEERVNTKNLIPDVALDKYISLIQGEHTDAVQELVFGTDGTTEASTDTSMGNPVHSEDFSGYSDQSTGESQWTGVVDSVEPQGQPYDIAEFGVRFEDGTLAARTTFPAETKDSTQEWRVRYNLTLSNA